MRISTTVGLQLDGPQTLDDVIDEVRRVAGLGFTGAWWSQTFGWDALTAITVAGRSVPHLPLLGTAVVPTALGPAMLRIAGELADGTVVTWATERSLDRHVVPRISAAAEAAGRPRPQVVNSLPVAVTADRDAARAWITERFGAANSLPSYRAMLDLEEVHGVDELAVAGDDDDVRRALGRLADAGTTEFIAVPFGPADQVSRTIELLGELATAAGAPLDVTVT